jgi:hypothetical protein
MNSGQNEQNFQNPDFVRFCEFCLKRSCLFVFIRLHAVAAYSAEAAAKAGLAKAGG